MLGAGRGGSVRAARLLAVQLVVQILDPLASIAPSATAVPTASAPHRGAKRAEDEEEEEEREQESEETEAEAPVRVPVVRDRRRAGGAGGGEAPGQAAAVRAHPSEQRE